MRTTSWSTQQLAEFLAVVSSFTTEAAVLLGAVERASEAFDAEIGALVRGGAVVASVGFAAGRVPEPELVAISGGGTRELHIPSVGPTEIAVAHFEDTPPGCMILARSGESFSTEEASLLHGMARVLALTLQTLRVLARERDLRDLSERQAAELRERHVFLERLSAIQRSISRNVPRAEVLDAIVAGASQLIRDEFVVLRVADPLDPSRLVAVAGNAEPELMERIAVIGRGEGLFTDELFAGKVVAIENYGEHHQALPMMADRVEAGMVAPVHENGVVVGGLVVASYRKGRTYSPIEQEMLLAFAEHVSLALASAKTLDAVTYQALHDSLTGLPNRALFLDRLEHSLARAARDPEREVAVLFLDLDRFKDVNDRLGHAAGDELLVAVGGRLRAALRTEDTAARMSGDEFAVLIEDAVSESSLARLAERLLESLRTPVALHGRDVALSASIGIAHGSTTGDGLLRDADVAMYRAKRAGPGTYEFFEPGMRAGLVERLELEADLRSAVANGELVLHLQPIVDLAAGAPVAVEALLRWQHPERGLLQPLAFIPLAEESGAIVGIGRWVLEEACRQGGRWLSQPPGGRPLALTVNLSGRQLERTELVGEVAHALEAAGLPPELLILEITETVLMKDAGATKRILAELKRLGVRIAVDDFGTGYSSLRYLQEFPLDMIKIAKPFVDTVAHGSERSALARAIIDLGGTFDLQVVAEGIERPEQLARLRELGCGFGQGYLFSRPQPPEALEHSLRRSARAAVVI